MSDRSLKLYAQAWQRGDVTVMFEMYSPDVTAHYGGRSSFAGTHQGKQRLIEVLAEGKIRQRLFDVVKTIQIGRSAYPPNHPRFAFGLWRRLPSSGVDRRRNNPDLCARLSIMVGDELISGNHAPAFDGYLFRKLRISRQPDGIVYVKDSSASGAAL